tara:strand:- start:372 stop:923 length:552 start_codon:yes stop_codon:yes gene_type:complete
MFKKLLIFIDDILHHTILNKKRELTMKITFDEIIEQILEHEGGYVNDPDDAGGETNFGIAKKFNPDVDIKNLTKEGAKEIYYNKYWLPAKVSQVPDKLKHIYFDMVVNFGQKGAVKVLQQSAVAKGHKIKVDGGIGTNTLKAIKNVELERVRSYRVLKFANIVIKKPSQEKFWFGWFRRAIEV